MLCHGAQVGSEMRRVARLASGDATQTMALLFAGFDHWAGLEGTTIEKVSGAGPLKLAILGAAVFFWIRLRVSRAAPR